MHRGVIYRPYIDYARELVDVEPSDAEKQVWSPNGWCEQPKVNLFVSKVEPVYDDGADVRWSPKTYDFILSPGGHPVAEDITPGFLKVLPIDGGFMVTNVTGIRLHIVQRLDGTGYEIRRREQHETPRHYC